MWVIHLVPFLFQGIMHFILYNFLFNTFPHMHRCWVSISLYHIRQNSLLFNPNAHLNNNLSLLIIDSHILFFVLCVLFSFLVKFPCLPNPIHWSIVWNPKWGIVLLTVDLFLRYSVLIPNKKHLVYTKSPGFTLRYLKSYSL